MKKLFLLSLILYSCKAPSPQHPGKDSSSKDSSTTLLPFAAPTTALTAAPVSVPAPFTMETLPVEDTAKHLHAVFYFPVSGNKKLDALTVKLVRKNLEGYEDYHPGPYEQASIEAWVSSFAISHSLISMCFTEQSFTDGAAHYNHGYSTLNYDTVLQKQVFLGDIFKLQTEKQKQEFCDSILSPEINTDFRITAEDLRSKTDFTLRNGKLIFYFDDYEKGPSMCTDTVPLRSLSKFLKPAYTNLLL